MQRATERFDWIPALTPVDDGEVRFYREDKIRASSRTCRFDQRTSAMDKLLNLPPPHRRV
jgi:hypothetical protein